MRRGVVLVPFTVTIPAEQRDTHLPAKPREEAGQILARAMEGALDWQRNGPAVPASVADASRDDLDGEDAPDQFLTEETVADGLAFVTTSALHQRFRQWSDAQGLPPWTLRTLQPEVASRGYAPAKPSFGNGVIGLRLR